MPDNAFYCGHKIYFTIDGESRPYSESKKHLIAQGFSEEEALTYLDSLKQKAE